VDVPFELRRQMEQWGEHVRMLSIHFQRLKWNRASFEKYQLIRDVAEYFPNVNYCIMYLYWIAVYCTDISPT